MGKTQVSIQVKDIRLSRYDDSKILNSEKDYEVFCSGRDLSETAKKNLCVDRDFCGNIYRFIKNNNGWNYSAEMLCYRLGHSEETLTSCKIALDVLSELGIIICKEGKYILPSENVRASLENSSVFRRASDIRNKM